MLDTRSEKKNREAKYVSRQTFLVCSYITLVFGGFGAATVESATISAAALFIFFFPPPSSFPSLYRRYLPPRVRSSVPRRTPPPAVCGRLLCEQMHPRATPCALVPRGPSACFSGRRTPVGDKGGPVERRPLSLSRAAVCIRSWCHGDETNGRHDDEPLSLFFQGAVERLVLAVLIQ